jgi:predicted  nucleic acid-binding Zn-ribbon protein
VTPLEALLAVQAHDTTIDQLRHRSATLPARAEVAAIESQLAELEKKAAEVGTELHAVDRRQKAAEDEVASLDAKITELDKKLYGGTVSAIKELQALQADIESLQRHKAEVEDREHAAMEEREPFDAELGAIDAERARHDDVARQLRAAIAEAEAELDGEIAREVIVRDDARALVPPVLIDEYDRLRDKLGGVAAARLEPGGRCGGCHLSLPAQEVARIKRELPIDALIHCEQCGRILVRVDG